MSTIVNIGGLVGSQTFRAWWTVVFSEIANENFDEDGTISQSSP